MYPTLPRVHSHNKLYYCISNHPTPICKFLECLGCESQRWIVVYWYTFSFSQTCLTFFEQPFLLLVWLVILTDLPSFMALNCAPVSVSHLVLAFHTGWLPCLLMNSQENAWEKGWVINEKYKINSFIASNNQCYLIWLPF